MVGGAGARCVVGGIGAERSYRGGSVLSNGLDGIGLAGDHVLLVFFIDVRGSGPGVSRAGGVFGLG